MKRLMVNHIRQHLQLDKFSHLQHSMNSDEIYARKK